MPADNSAPQLPYTPAIRAGDFLFISGQVPRDPATRVVIGDDIEEQTHAVMKNLFAVLAAASGKADSLVKVHVYLTDMSHVPDFNRIYISYFPHRLPARTTVGAALNGVMIEIDAVAYVGDKELL